MRLTIAFAFVFVLYALIPLTLGFSLPAAIAAGLSVCGFVVFLMWWAGV